MIVLRGWMIALAVLALGCSQSAGPPPAPVAKPRAPKPPMPPVPVTLPQVQAPGERLLLFTKRGPLLIEVFVTIDGQPYLTVQERLIDELLKIADSDSDDTPTWDEALAHPQFSRFVATNPGETAPTAEQQKKN
jgi:hypothetical protein